MPKNEQGNVYCINNYDHTSSMTKESDPVLLPYIKKIESQEKRVLQVGKGIAVEVYTCPKCGYIEFYEFKDEDED